MTGAAGRFITVEGSEGAGKSTQARRLAAALRGAGKTVLLTREPGGTPAAEAIRALVVNATVPMSPLTEALLHYAARREHLDEAILPALARGAWVISDRYADSTMAYQGYGHGLGRAAIERLHALVVPDIRPDLTVVFDLEAGRGLARARARSPAGDRYERLGSTFHTRVRDGFLEIAAREPDRCVVVSAVGGEDAVAARVCAAVGDRLGLVL